MTDNRGHDHTLARWTCGCDPTLTGLLHAAATTGNIEVAVGLHSPRPTCGWPADNARRGPCGQPGVTMVMVGTFDEPPLATLTPGDEKPSILILCEKHGKKEAETMNNWNVSRNLQGAADLIEAIRSGVTEPGVGQEWIADMPDVAAAQLAAWLRQESDRTRWSMDALPGAPAELFARSILGDQHGKSA